MRTTIRLLLVLLASLRTIDAFAPSGRGLLLTPQRQQTSDHISSQISHGSPKSPLKWPSSICMSSISDDEKEEEEEELIEVVDVVPTELGTMPSTRLQRFRKKYFSKPDDGLTFKQRMAKAGLSVVLSYGWVSNVSYSITLSLAWYIFNKQTGLSPLAPGQWKGFLAVYAGFYVFNNIIRPLRFGLSVGVSVYFDRIIKKIQDIFKVGKGLAIFLTVFFANVVGTCALMALGITAASMASGVPIFVPK